MLRLHCLIFIWPGYVYIPDFTANYSSSGISPTERNRHSMKRRSEDRGEGAELGGIETRSLTKLLSLCFPFLGACTIMSTDSEKGRKQAVSQPRSATAVCLCSISI